MAAISDPTGWNYSLPTAHCRLPTILLLAFILALALTNPAMSMPAQDSNKEQIRTEIKYRDGTVILLSDSQSRITQTRYRAEGHVKITFQDMIATGDEAQYDMDTREGFIVGHVRFSQKDQWLTCSRAEFNFNSQTGVFYNASGYTDRQFSIKGHTILKTGPDTYRVEDSFVTSCQEKRPKWVFQASRMDIRVDHTARLHNTVFRIKGIPVFYAPYLVLPMEKKERSSGFTPFHTGTSTSKGRVLSDAYYQTLGKSADATVYGDYFTLRGLAIGGIFRANPNPETHFYVEAYGINDKLNQGGAQLTVDGVSQLKDDWRAVARVNITSSFTFQQAFSDTFRAATVPQELATAFLTRDHDSLSTNIAFERQEVLFPIRSLVIRKVPSVEFLSLGTPLGNSPLILSFRTSLDGISRTDSQMETHFIQRLDFYPRLTLRLPEIKGFSLVPTVGVRETYYGAQLSSDSESGVTNSSLNRRYTDLSLELRMPILEGNVSFPWLGKMQHTIEPYITYRWIHGINDFDKTIRFDEQDAIADTNEIEYGIVNRFFRNRTTGTGTNENQEFMSFALVQKYYFDPTFGGAFRPEQPNSFYPLDTVTGFYQTGTLSNLAPVSAILEVSPQNGIHNDVRVDYDTRLQQLRDESLSSYWHQAKFVISATYFRNQDLQPNMLAANHIQGQIGYSSPRQQGFASSFTVSYNLKTGQWLNSNTRVNYTWNCCGVAVEFDQFDLGLRIESKFSFSFMLKGIGNFGNLKRPESLF